MPQRQPRSAPRATARRPARRKIEFIASVRFKDGECQLFAVSNAKTFDEARQMVLDEVSNVASVLIAERPAQGPARY